MTVQLAIHASEGSFSERWMAYCDEHKIPYRLVNCLDSDIIAQLASVDALLWHWRYPDPHAQLMARQVIMAAEAMGVAVFPSTATCWHYDDKVGQKYLLEAVGAPLVPTYVFYDLGEALQWIDGAVFPKVFKLRIGAGSLNVRLVRHAQEARTLARQAFAGGFRPVASYQQDARNVGVTPASSATSSALSSGYPGRWQRSDGSTRRWDASAGTSTFKTSLPITSSTRASLSLATGPLPLRAMCAQATFGPRAVAILCMTCTESTPSAYQLPLK